MEYSPKNPEGFKQVEIPPIVPPPLNIVPISETQSTVKSGDFISPNYSRGKAGWRLGSRGEGEFNELWVRGNFVTVPENGNISEAINKMYEQGGGDVILSNGTYYPGASIYGKSGVNVRGTGGGTVIDFGGGAFGFILQGEDAYSTGTASVTIGSTAVTGSGTTWTAAMVGQSILVGDYWYEITARSSNTAITIGSPYLGTSDSGISYIIATTIDNVKFADLNVTNSSGNLFDIRYCNNLTMDSVVGYTASYGLYGLDSSFVFLLNCSFDSCTSGVYVNNYHYGMYINSGALGNSGSGFTADTARNWSIIGVSLEASGGSGMTLNRCTNMGIENFSATNNSIDGITVSTDCIGLTIANGSFARNGVNGLSLYSTATRTIVSLCDFDTNGEYGVRLATSAVDNLVSSNTFVSNGLSAALDAGSGTKIRSNIGLADN